MSYKSFYQALFVIILTSIVTILGVEAQNSEVKRWHIGFGAGVSLFRFDNVNLFLCPDPKKCYNSPDKYFYEVSTIYSLEVAYKFNSKYHFFSGLERSNKLTKNNAYVYSDQKIVESIKDFAIASNFKIGGYVGARHYVLDTKHFKPYYGIRQAMGHESTFEGLSRDPTFQRQYILNTSNIYHITYGQIGCSMLKERVRLNLDVPLFYFYLSKQIVIDTSPVHNLGFGVPFVFSRQFPMLSCSFNLFN